MQIFTETSSLKIWLLSRSGDQNNKTGNYKHHENGPTLSSARSGRGWVRKVLLEEIPFRLPSQRVNRNKWREVFWVGQMGLEIPSRNYLDIGSLG